MADPGAEPLRLGGDGRLRLRPGVLEQPDRDLAVAVLRPAAHDPAVPPDRGTDVPPPAEQGRPAPTTIPGPVAPADPGAGEGWQERRPRFAARGLVLVGGQHDA